MVINFSQGSPSAPLDEAAIEALLEEGLNHHKNGQLDQAAACYRRVLDTEPDNVDALYLTGGVHMMRDNFLEAVMYLSRALQAEPEFAPAFGLLGDAQKNLGDLENATVNYRRAVEFEPENFDLWNQYGNALRLKGYIAGAQEAYATKCRLKYRAGETALSDDVDFSFTYKTKLRHDIEQFRYLLDQEKID